MVLKLPVAGTGETEPPAQSWVLSVMCWASLPPPPELLKLSHPGTQINLDANSISRLIFLHFLPQIFSGVIRETETDGYMIKICPLVTVI